MRRDIVSLSDYVCRPVIGLPLRVFRGSRLLLDREVLGQVGVGLGGGLVLVLDRAPELFAVDRNRARRGDADAHAGAGDLDDLDHDVVAEHDLLARASRDDEHGTVPPWSRLGTGAIGTGTTRRRCVTQRPRVPTRRTAVRAPVRREPG